MSEEVLKEILQEAVMAEYTMNDNKSEHRFSLKHRLAMKRIFAKYERNVELLRKKESDKHSPIFEYNPKSNIGKRLLVSLLVIVLMTFLVGWVVVYFSEKFSGIVYPDNTQLTAVAIESSPTTITQKYALASLPDGFMITKNVSLPMCNYTLYTNKQTGQEITLRQWAKSYYAPHYNTEQHYFEEIDINGKSGLYIDSSIGTYYQSILVWDNEDYIIEIIADLDKESTNKLSKINKI